MTDATVLPAEALRTVRLLSNEALPTYWCSNCGKPIVQRGEIERRVFLMFIANGAIDGLCPKCQQERDHE